MTGLSAKELDEWMKETMPTMYDGNGVAIGADIGLKCWYIHSVKYRVDWFWAEKTFRIVDNSHASKIIFSSPIAGNLSLFCHMDDGAVLYCDAEMFDVFVERLLGMRVFE